MNKAIFTTLLLAGTASGLQAAEYRSPSDMNADERVALMSMVRDYSSCIRENAMQLNPDYPGVRELADAAMGQCSGKLVELEKKMTTMNLDPGFVKGYVAHSRNHVVRQMLPEIMRLKAAGN